MDPITLVFLSSADIALPLLQTLCEDERFQVRALICQPDKPAGRKGELKAPATKVFAVARGIPVFQPERLSRATSLLERWSGPGRPDFLLTFAYGQILNQEWLDVARVAPVNVHTSLLPLYRGASPIQAALLNGDEMTGISTMKMVKAMDEGPVAFQHEVAITPEMDAGMLHDALAALAAEELPQDLIDLHVGGPGLFVEQDHGKATYCGKIRKQDGFVDFQDSAANILNRFRAYSPWPGLWTTFEGKRLKLLALNVVGRDLESGQVLLEEDRLYVGTKQEALRVDALQLEGRQAMDMKAFMLGQPGFSGSVLPS